MRILHVSDVHCSTSNLRAVLEAEEYDAVAVTGDLECVEAVEVLKRAGGSVAAVTGNMDGYRVRQALAEAGFLVEARAVDIAGLRFVGVGGLSPHSDVEALKGLEKVDVLLSHHPPRGTLDRTFIGVRAGLKDLTELSRRLAPKAHLFGHIHEARGVELQGQTLYVNAGPLSRGFYAIVVLEGGRAHAELRKL